MLWYATAGAGTATTTYTFTACVLTADVDDLGQPITTIDISAMAAAVRDASEWWVSIDGGQLDETATGAIRGAGSLAMWLLRRSTLRVDYGRWSALRAVLDRYRVGGYASEVVSPWEFLADNLLPILPVSVLSGPQGLYPVLWRWDAQAEDAVHHLRLEAGVTRTSAIEYDRGPDEVVSEVRVRWAHNAASGEYGQTTTLTAHRTGDELSSLHARTSYQRAGSDVDLLEQTSVEVESDWIADDATAATVAADTLARLGFASRLVDYEVGYDLAWLDLGDVLLVTDPDVYLSSAVALLVGLSLSDGGGLRLSLLLTEDPARDSVSTGPDPTVPNPDDPPTPEPDPD